MCTHPNCSEPLIYIGHGHDYKAFHFIRPCGQEFLVEPKYPDMEIQLYSYSLLGENNFCGFIPDTDHPRCIESLVEDGFDNGFLFLCTCCGRRYRARLLAFQKVSGQPIH